MQPPGFQSHKTKDCIGMLTKDFMPSYEHGCPIWVLMLLAYFCTKLSLSIYRLSAIATFFSLLGLIMAAMTIELGTELSKHDPTMSETTESVVAIVGVTSMIVTILLSHVGVALWTATCLRIAHSIFS